MTPLRKNQAGPQGTDSHYKSHLVRKSRETPCMLEITDAVMPQMEVRSNRVGAKRICKSPL